MTGETYIFTIRSSNRLSGGSINNLNINVPFRRILNNAPYNKFQVRGSFHTNMVKINDIIGQNIDQENCEVRVSLPSINDYDTQNENAGGFMLVGIAERKLYSSVMQANYSTLTLDFSNSYKHIINKPQNEFINIALINPKNNLPYRATAVANNGYDADLTNGEYILVLELQGIE